MTTKSYDYVTFFFEPGLVTYVLQLFPTFWLLLLRLVLDEPSEAFGSEVEIIVFARGNGAQESQGWRSISCPPFPFVADTFTDLVVRAFESHPVPVELPVTKSRRAAVLSCPL